MNIRSAVLKFLHADRRTDMDWQFMAKFICESAEYSTTEAT
jgi:hypothetical protein